MSELSDHWRMSEENAIAIDSFFCKEHCCCYDEGFDDTPHCTLLPQGEKINENPEFHSCMLGFFVTRALQKRGSRE